MPLHQLEIVYNKEYCKVNWWMEGFRDTSETLQRHFKDASETLQWQILLGELVSVSPDQVQTNVLIAALACVASFCYKIYVIPKSPARENLMTKSLRC